MGSVKRISEMVRQVRPTAPRTEDEIDEVRDLAQRWRDASPTRHGLKALLAGPHARERQLAALALARHAGAPLYRADLHGVMDKYIGETEKNLRRVLRLAERIGAVLLLDEAEALFAKRTHVVDRLDRHANVDVGNLLLQLEDHRGLVILTAGDEKGLDEGLIRITGATIRLSAGDKTPEPELVPVTWTATPEAVAKYAELTDDFNPIHLDPAFAAATPFGQPIAQGTLTLNLVWQSLRETFGPAALPGMEIDVRFAAPVRVGETVTATGQPRPGNDAVYDVAVTASDGTVVLSGTAITAHIKQDASQGSARR